MACANIGVTLAVTIIVVAGIFGMAFVGAAAVLSPHKHDK